MLKTSENKESVEALSKERISDAYFFRYFFAGDWGTRDVSLLSGAEFSVVIYKESEF